jgi:hypothetical protein
MIVRNGMTEVLETTYLAHGGAVAQMILIEDFREWLSHCNV